MPGNKWLAKKCSYVLLTGLVCFCFLTASAQGGDTTKPAQKPVKYSDRSAKKIMLYAALCPGLGQIYNKQYWKLPILYGGLGTAIYFIIFNQHYYNHYNSLLDQ